MKQHGTRLAGVLTAGVLALVPAFAQNPQAGGQSQGSGQSQSSQGVAGQRDSGQAHDKMGSANRMSGDSGFLQKAAVGGMAEVKLGQLATQKASHADVKSFGQQMVNDHGKANEELKQLASQKGVTLPSDIDAKHQATYDRLSKLDGAAFDKAYVQEMLRDHREDVNEFRKQSKSASDPEVKAWAAKTLPTLEQHLQNVESLSGKVK